MSTITATADNAKSQVRLDLDFSDIDAPYVSVTRVDQITGAASTVRGHGVSTTINGQAYWPMQAGYKAVMYDTEMPLDQAFRYVASAPTATMNATSTFGDGYTDPWYATATTVQVFATANKAGAFFMSVQTDGATGTPTVRAEDIPATPGATFTMVAAVSSNASQSVTIGLTALDASGATVGTSNTNNPTVTSATTMSVSIVCPANTVAVRPLVAMTGTPPATTIVSFSSLVVTTSAGSATSNGATVQSLGACQLKDPLRPGLNVRVDFQFDPNPQCIPTEGVFFQSVDAESRAANSASFNVNNQTTPVVVSKSRSAVTSTLTLVSRTFADRDRLNAILVTGSPLLFQVPSEYGVRDRLLSVGTTTVSRVLPDHRFPIRVFSLPFASVASPGGPMQGTVGARWSDTCNKYATWGLVNAAGLTWTQVLDGLAG